MREDVRVDLCSGLCRGMRRCSRRCERLCSGSSFPLHVVNGLWLVLSDAPALGYPTLMCSAHSVSCCMASTIQKMCVCVRAHCTWRHTAVWNSLCDFTFFFFFFFFAAYKIGRRRAAVSLPNMNQDTQMDKLHVNLKLKEFERLLNMLSNGFTKHWQG